jgi:hypothetical protein
MNQSKAAKSHEKTPSIQHSLRDLKDKNNIKAWLDQNALNQVL